MEDLWQIVVSESRRQAKAWAGLDVDEIASETVFRAFLWLRSNPETADTRVVRALIRTIARRVGWRVAKQKSSSLPNAELLEACSPESVVARTEQYHLALIESISLLSEDERAMVESFMARRSIAAIGREIGITRQSAHKRFAKIIAKLQSLMEAKLDQ